MHPVLFIPPSVYIGDIFIPLSEMYRKMSDKTHNDNGVLLYNFPLNELHPDFIHPTALLNDSSARVPIIGLFAFCFS